MTEFITVYGRDVRDGKEYKFDKLILKSTIDKPPRFLRKMLAEDLALQESKKGNDIIIYYVYIKCINSDNGEEVIVNLK
jgi:hypothetical protein